MSGLLQTLTTLADGVLLLCALSLILWPAPRSARAVLVFETVLVGAGSAVGASGGAGGSGGWDGPAVALGLAAACLLAVLWLFRGTADGSTADGPGADGSARDGGWPRFEDSAATSPAAMRLRLPAASGFVAIMVVAVLAAGSLSAPLPAPGGHGARLVLAVGLTAALVGAAVAGRRRACGLVQAAGVLTALLAAGWTAVRLLAAVPPATWQQGGLPGTPASWLAVALLPALLMVLALLAMRAMSATLREWLLNEQVPR